MDVEIEHLQSREIFFAVVAEVVVVVGAVAVAVAGGEHTKGRTAVDRIVKIILKSGVFSEV